MNKITNIIRKAFRNSNNPDLVIGDGLSLRKATLDAAWAKHGPDSKVSSHLTGEVKRADFEAIFESAEWHFLEGDSDGIVVAFTSTAGVGAVAGAVAIDDIPADTVCTVEALGHHPTLTCEGESAPTKIITAVIEDDGSSDPDLGDCRENLKGEPVLVTWFPGEALPPSNPTDCAVGDSMTAAEAKARGWRVVSFKS